MSVVFILLLDCCADVVRPAYAKAVVMIIHCLGCSVGLGWEQVFHKCVDVCVGFMVEDRQARSLGAWVKGVETRNMELLMSKLMVRLLLHIVPILGRCMVC